MTARRALCRAADIAEGTAKGFPAASGGLAGLFAVKRGGVVRVFVNSCPHLGLPLEPVPDRFLDRKGELIVCAAHGARFRVADGVCVSGPCLGEALQAVPAAVVDGVVMVPATAASR